jgi:hypothetical protein
VLRYQLPCVGEFFVGGDFQPERLPIFSDSGIVNYAISAAAKTLSLLNKLVNAFDERFRAPTMTDQCRKSAESCGNTGELGGDAGPTWLFYICQVPDCRIDFVLQRCPQCREAADCLIMAIHIAGRKDDHGLVVGHGVTSWDIPMPFPNARLWEDQCDSPPSPRMWPRFPPQRRNQMIGVLMRGALG